MKLLFNAIFFSTLLITLLPVYAFSSPPALAIEVKQLVKDAIVYGVENMDPQQDYSKYVAKTFMTQVDGKIFNYAQWRTHMQHIKSTMRSLKVSFKEVVTQGNIVAADYVVHLVKKDGSELDVKVIEFFWVKDNKIVYGDELTHMISGNEADKNIGSLS